MGQYKAVTKLFNRQIWCLRFNLIQFDFIRVTSGANCTILGVSNHHCIVKNNSGALLIINYCLPPIHELVLRGAPSWNTRLEITFVLLFFFFFPPCSLMVACIYGIDSLENMLCWLTASLLTCSVSALKKEHRRSFSQHQWRRLDKTLIKNLTLTSPFA